MISCLNGWCKLLNTPYLGGDDWEVDVCIQPLAVHSENQLPGIRSRSLHEKVSWSANAVQQKSSFYDEWTQTAFQLAGVNTTEGQVHSLSTRQCFLLKRTSKINIHLNMYLELAESSSFGALTAYRNPSPSAFYTCIQFSQLPHFFACPSPCAYGILGRWRPRQECRSASI